MERIEGFLRQVERCSTLVQDIPRQVQFEREPKDEPYLDLALYAGASFLVTRDRDLLDLQAESVAGSTELGQRLSQLSIVDPVAPCA